MNEYGRKAGNKGEKGRKEDMHSLFPPKLAVF